ncbi:MAG: nickel pincer cofactor biosynthesis protein LarB [Oscillospiraceae bacterium]|nr:nickel pincer cofactor biosynthesis protein LarB [Oscillospiraceae bacterium]
MDNEIRRILTQVEEGAMTVDEALLHLKYKPFEDLGYAKVDTHRRIRQGAPEVIYGAGKTPEQIEGIVSSMRQNGTKHILITRLSPEGAEALSGMEGFEYFEDAKAGVVGGFPEPDGMGDILIVTGGTSDIPVAKEAAITARVHGSNVIPLYDVGVSGIHRLLSNMELIMSASVIVAVAGMEGALASVVGGLADCPVVAVPTSVGYGASFGGVSALLSMLNSCASGVAVMNIDNGFGAGYYANMINHMGVRK